MQSESKIIASEDAHWYTREGKPLYEVPCTSKGAKKEFRPTSIKDARKLDLVPSYSKIKNEIAKPGLDIWKLNQVLSAALKTERLPNEPMEDFSRRVVEEYNTEGERVRERGKELHAAIEDFIRGTRSLRYQQHFEKILEALEPFGVDLLACGVSAEHSFASELGYGGKIDWRHDSGVLIDFKTKDRIDDKKQLVWDEHPMQCAAYGYGVFKPDRTPNAFRGLNVFIGVDDCEVRVFEHEWKDLTRGWEMFKSLLRYWQIKHGFK